MTDDLRVNLKSLKRTEGARQEFCVRGSLGETIQTGLAAIPSGEVITVAGSLESVGDGVLVTATVRGRGNATCSRCLAEFTFPAQASFQELFVYPEHAPAYHDEDVLFIVNEWIDLAAVVRDALILDQSPSPLCKPDCRGLCPRCGADLNTDPSHRHDETVDARWSALAEWGRMS